MIASLSVGGASYALFRVEKAPTWLKFTSVMSALVAMIYALAELPGVFDAVRVISNSAVAGPDQDVRSILKERTTSGRRGMSGKCHSR